MVVSLAEKTAEWHERRKLGIGGSEAAASVGLSPWMDPIRLWAIKRGEEQPAESSFRMRLGNLVEPVIGMLYTERTGTRLRASRMQFIAQDYPFIRAHPDFRIIGARGLVQAKLVGDADSWGRPADDWSEPNVDAIPVHYRLQGIHEMIATGFEFVDFACLTGGFNPELRIFRLPFDAALAEDLIAEEGVFWQHVVDGTMPEPGIGSIPELRRRFPKPDGTTKVASAEQEQVIGKYLTRRSERLVAEKLEEALLAKVIGYIGDADAIEAGGSRIGYGLVKGNVKWKDVATELWDADAAAVARLAYGTLDDFAHELRAPDFRKLAIGKAGRA